MNNIEIAILNYENQLVANRKQLNDLIYSYQNGQINTALLNDKINYLQVEIQYMENQLNILKSSLRNPAYAQENMPQMQNGVPQAQGHMPSMQNGMPQPGNTRRPGKDLENVIGRSWMGIFASVLIFISFVLFAVVLAPFITDNIKMAAMYIVSIALTAFGLIKLRGQKNKTYLAISGCGVGAIYISLLLSNIYFKAISEIVLYALLLIWVVFVCYLARLQDMVFQIIGQSGITISVLFGIYYCADTQDTMMVFLLSLFFAITATVFYVSNFNKEFDKNIINNTFNAVNVGLLGVGLFAEMESGRYMQLAGIVVLIFLLLQFVFFFLSRLKEENIQFGIFTAINGAFVLLLLSYLVASATICGILNIVMGGIILAVTERKCRRKDDAGRILLQIFCMILFVLSLGGIPLYKEDIDISIVFFKEHINISIVMILMAALGYFRNDKVFKYGSFVIMCMYLFVDLNPVEYLCLGAVYFGLVAYAMFVKKEQYDIVFKLLSYVACLIFMYLALGDILQGVNTDISLTIVFFVVSIVNLAAMKSCFTKNLATMQPEMESTVVTQVVHAISMLYVLYAITDVQNEVCHCMLILLAIVLFMINSKNIISRWEGLLPGIYIGIKLTVLVVTVLYSFDAVNYVISVSAFLLAIISIVVGFRLRIKSFRIYGLILSMLSVIKLIMIDISYENTLGHALSFFISGILCFVISMIYNVISKRVHTDEMSGGMDNESSSL